MIWSIFPNFGILYKKIAEARRKLGRDREMDDLDEVFEQRFDTDGSWTRPPRPVDADTYAAEIRAGIEGCLEGVPTKHRLVFVLREVEGMSYEEIATVVGVSAKTVSTRLHRARKQL